MIELTVEGNAVVLPVRIIPGASATRYLGEWEGRARIAVSAPPEKGKANKALVAFLAKKLDVRKQDVSVVRGLTSPLKDVRIEGATAERVRAALTA